MDGRKDRLVWTCDDCGTQSQYPRGHSKATGHMAWVRDGGHRLTFSDDAQTVTLDGPGGSKTFAGRNPTPIAVEASGALVGAVAPPTSRNVFPKMTPYRETPDYEGARREYMGATDRDRQRAALRLKFRSLRRELVQFGMCEICSGETEHFPFCPQYMNTWHSWREKES